MRSFAVVLLGALAAASLVRGQQPAPVPQAAGTNLANSLASPSYAPPTQAERFRIYIRHTFSIASVLEAGAHAGIQQARDRPSQWPEGAQGYGERLGSAMGRIAVRGTTQYLVADLFREDLRYSSRSESKFKAALEDTFTARRGSDGHRTLSVARLVGPISGSIVAANLWYPAGYEGRDIAKETALTYGMVFVRNLVREFVRR